MLTEVTWLERPIVLAPFASLAMLLAVSVTLMLSTLLAVSIVDRSLTDAPVILKLIPEVAKSLINAEVSCPST